MRSRCVAARAIRAASMLISPPPRANRAMPPAHHGCSEISSSASSTSSGGLKVENDPASTAWMTAALTYETRTAGRIKTRLAVSVTLTLPGQSRHTAKLPGVVFDQVTLPCTDAHQGPLLRGHRDQVSSRSQGTCCPTNPRQMVPVPFRSMQASGQGERSLGALR
eukprot:SAG31_NODE_5069_length_2761_cov_11.750699_4_plen_165_part_00